MHRQQPSMVAAMALAVRVAARAEEATAVATLVVVRDCVESAGMRSGRAPGSFGTPEPPREPVSI